MPRFLLTADWQIGRQYSQFLPEDAVPHADDVFDAQTESDRTDNTLFNAVAALGASRSLPIAEEIAALTCRDRQGGQPPGVEVGMTWEVEAP